MTVRELIDYFGGISKMARTLGCTTQAIYAWGETIPRGRAYEIEVLTKGEVKAVDLPIKEAA